MTFSKLFFTICDVNYIHYAMACASSTIKNNLDSKFCIVLVFNGNENNELLISKLKDEIVFRNRIEIVIDNDIVKNLHLDLMKKKYNIIEFCTSIKPFCFEYFLEKYNFVTYLDPDIFVYNNLDFKRSDSKSQISLTPHILTSSDTPEMVSKRREFKYLQVGYFNLGYIGITKSDESFSFLKWWQNRLIDLCLIDSKRGIFVDQKWIDVAFMNNPGLFHVIQDVGWNIAYWNIYERDHKLITEDNNLKFIHFSARNNLLNIPDWNQYLKKYEYEVNINKDFVNLYTKKDVKKLNISKIRDFLKLSIFI